jgi:hypothetical protein
MKIESKKTMLQQNDIIRYNGMTYRVDFIQPNGGVYILHELSTGVRIPCMLKNKQYTILMNKRLKNDIKRSVRTLRRYNSRNPRKTIDVPTKSFERIDEEPTKGDVSDSSKIHIIESYICEQEISTPSPTPEPTQVTTISSTEQVSNETSVENKKDEEQPSQSTSYIGSYSSYCSIM